DISIDNDRISNIISSNSDSETFESDSEVEIAEGYNIMFLGYLNNTIKQLEKEIRSNKHSEVIKAHLYTMLSYFRLVEHDYEKIKASIIVAEAAGKGVYHACCIRAWTVNYVKNGEFPSLRQGKHSKTWNELAKYVNKKILPRLCFDLSPTICVRTARKWLKVFGFEYSEVRKGMYMDRHEHADVVAYHERFLERMAEFEAYMIVFSSENMKEETKPDLIILSFW
ncbi:19209_t:CDS:2, partial [Dentiscutata erythropus]